MKSEEEIEAENWCIEDEVLYNFSSEANALIEKMGNKIDRKLKVSVYDRLPKSLDTKETVYCISMIDDGSIMIDNTGKTFPLYDSEVVKKVAECVIKDAESRIY